MELQAAFLQETEKPKAIIAHTIKGKGVSFAENNVDWHISYLTKEMYEQVIGEWNCAGDNLITGRCHRVGKDDVCTDGL